MATVSSLVITIDAATDIVMSASPVSPTELGVTAYSEPAILPRINYAPDSPYLHGSTALGWTYDQAVLNFTVGTMLSATEAEARGHIATLRAAVSRLSYNVTVNVDGAGDEVWACTVGAVTPVGPRDMVNIRTHKTEWNVSIPCYPVSS